MLFVLFYVEVLSMSDDYNMKHLYFAKYKNYFMNFFYYKLINFLL